MAYPVLGIAAMNVSLYEAASALNANSRWQEVIAENLDAASIPGYRRSEISFAAVQAGMMPVASTNPALSPTQFVMPRAVTSVSFAAGPGRYTGSFTHFAIDGPGFFEVQMPDGSTAFTRNGEFQINGQGTLVTKQGYTVLTDSGPVQMDLTNSAPLMVSSTGEITQGQDLKGRLKLTEFGNPNALTRISNSYFQMRDPAAQPTPAVASAVQQNWLENSNASAITEMVKLMSSMRSFEVNQQVIRMQDERMGKTITELTNG